MGLLPIKVAIFNLKLNLKQPCSVGILPKLQHRYLLCLSLKINTP